MQFSLPFSVLSLLIGPTPLAERTKERVSGCLVAGIAVSNPAGGIQVCCECCQVECSATGRLLVHRSPTHCGASLYII